MTLSQSALSPRAVLAAAGLAGALLLGVAARAQGPGGGSGGGANNAPGATTPAQAQATAGALEQLSEPGGQNLAAPTDSSYKGSLVTGKATDGVMDLSLDDAIARGLKQNLGLILQTTAQQNAKGQELEALQALLPTVTGDASIEVEQVNLAAYGLKFPGLNPIIGPFQVVDFRAYLTQNLVNVPSLEH